MRNYRRVTYEDRCQIYAYLQAKLPKRLIAKEIGFHRSTIYRDIRRNTVSTHGYEPPRATAQAIKRFRRCRRTYIINAERRRWIKGGLQRDWSPEQISGRLDFEHVAKISHQTIYRHVRRNQELAPKLRRYQRRGAGRYLQRRKLLESRLWINERPEIANQRKRIGDWERDGMYGANRKQLLVCTDRKSRFTRIAKITDSRSSAIAQLTKALVGANAKTLTNDNGPEFKYGPKLDIPIYFCYPLRPQQRGTVENTIGLLRQYVKRNTKLDLLRPKQIKKIENKLNFRPRKCLNFKTLTRSSLKKLSHWQWRSSPIPFGPNGRMAPLGINFRIRGQISSICPLTLLLCYPALLRFCFFRFGLWEVSLFIVTSKEFEQRARLRL
jgi:IS30 family transposase